MLKLLMKKPFNRKLKKQEKLQIGFDKKSKTERIYGDNAKEIYYKEGNIKHYKIGSLFLDYLSDNVSEIFSVFLDDIFKQEDINNLEMKYVNSYTFYFKYFFEDKYKQEGIEEIKHLKEKQGKEFKEFCINVIQRFENTKTIRELVNIDNNYNGQVTKQGKKLIGGNAFFRKNASEESIEYLIVNSKCKRILDFFVEKAYIKQIYKLLIDYCFFMKDTADFQERSKSAIIRFLYFRNEYDALFNLKETRKGNMLHFIIPEAIANFTKNKEVVYCYCIDEFSVNDLKYGEYTDKGEELQQFIITNRFFNISLLELLEGNNIVGKCQNCNRYFILNKKGTHYCNNPSPQNKNRTCSSYMKEYNYKNKINKDAEKKAINKAIKKAGDRIYSYWKPFLASENREKHLIKREEEKKQWKEKLKAKEKEYKKGKITSKDFLNWIDKSNRRR